jgi:hypothetical protein
MFLAPLPFHRRDDTYFDIEVVRCKRSEAEDYAVRVWHDGTIVNDPKDRAFARADDAYHAGIEFAKHFKRV